MGCAHLKRYLAQTMQCTGSVGVLRMVHAGYVRPACRGARHSKHSARAPAPSPSRVHSVFTCPM